MPDESQRPRRFVTTIVEVEGRDERKVVELPAFEPEPWAADSPLTIVGQSVPRVDAAAKVTGRARYTADIERPGMLHAVLVRATIARGRVTAMDFSAARQVAGVLDVLSAAQLPPGIRVSGGKLFDAAVSYAGQPLAAVCAETLEQARHAAGLVRVTYEQSTPVVTFSQSVAPDAPAVRKNGNVTRSSPSVTERGDIEAGLAAADVVVRRSYRTPSALHTALEPHGAVAEWEDDVLTVWESTQGVFAVRDQVATALGLPQSRVRVIMDHMGGGFGAKNSAGAHTLVAALCAQRSGRPVRCVLDRYGEQVDTGHRPETHIHVTLGARRDGTLTAIAAESEVTLGIGGWEASPTAMLHELYACANVRTQDVFAYVNQQAMAAFRGPGHVEGAFALECAMDALATETNLDPMEVRLRNYAGRDQGKERAYSSDGLRACYEEGARRFGWWEREERRQGIGTARQELVTENGESEARFHTGGDPASSNNPADHDNAGNTSKRRGFGMAAQIWGAGGGPPAYATVRLNSDGTIDVLSGTQDLGTGARTVFAQIAAESLGARFADVRVILGDTERTPYAGNSWGSMTTASVGPAVRMAAEEAQRKLFEAASEMLECDPADLTARASVITTRDHARSLTFSEVTTRLGNVMLIGQGSRGPNPREVGLVTAGVQFAEVEVDVDTGVVRVLRMVAVHDAGRVVNPMLAESQLVGGILQGIGFALFEDRIVHEQTGSPLTTGAHDYKIPTMRDVPAIDASCLVRSDIVANHVGARGLAEPPIIPTAPAIANAVRDALGVEITELPITPWRVLGAMRSAATA